MIASKFLISTAAAAAVVGAIGIAVAQTSPPAYSPTDTKQPSQTQSTQYQGSSTATPSSGSTNMGTMSTERDARADRN